MVHSARCVYKVHICKIVKQNTDRFDIAEINTKKNRNVEENHVWKKNEPSG